MPKQKDYEIGRKYKQIWEKEFSWLKSASDGSNNAFCKLCSRNLIPKLDVIRKHSKSKDHEQRESAVLKTNKSFFDKQAQISSDSLKSAEIKFAVSTCCHSAIRSIDHMSELIAENSNGSKLAEMRLHRTKCSKLLTEVISPSLKEELANDLKDVLYSLLVDESTDVSSTKHLCVCVRFFNRRRGKIDTAFLGLTPVIRTTGEVLFQAIKELIGSFGLQIVNCIGLGTDGANNMVGMHNSVWSRIKAEAPNCILNRCICHSLALCVKDAFVKMPSSMGYLLHEIPNWFSQSSLRREDYLQLFSVMNPNLENCTNPTPFQTYAPTRWLCRGKVMFNILVNWFELKAYFLAIEKHCDPQCKHRIRVLLDVFNDHRNYLYLTFLTPVVQEFDKLNTLFQSKDCDPDKLFGDLDLQYKSLKSRLKSPGGANLGLNSVDYGAKFVSELARIEREHKLPESVGKEVKLRCQTFLLELLDQVEKRLPDVKSIFQGLAHLHPKIMLSHWARPSFGDLPLPHLLAGPAIEEQYRKLVLVPWSSESVFGGNLPTETSDFWIGVGKHVNAVGELDFKDLSEYALNCLCMPVSNATVERIFSHVTIVKTKTRNKMSLQMLDSILRIRTMLFLNNMCCKDFKVTKLMLSKFNTQTMYEKAPETQDETALDLL